VGSRTIVLGYGSEEDVLGVGTYQLRLRGVNKLLLHDALYAPRVRYSVVPFVLLMRIGFSFSFRINGLDLFYNGNLFGHATLKGDFIVLDLDNTYDNTSAAFVSYFDSNSESVKWHARLGHVGQDRMRRLVKEGLLDQLTRVKLPRCELCLASKATIKPFSKAIRASSPLELIRSDTCGPNNVKARHGDYILRNSSRQLFMTWICVPIIPFAMKHLMCSNVS